MQQVTGIWIASFSTKSMAKRAFRRYMQTALTISVLRTPITPTKRA